MNTKKNPAQSGIFFSANRLSFLHEDVPELSKKIYESLSKNDSVNLEFEQSFYEKYERPLAVLENKKLISKQPPIIGSKIPLQINLTDPTYIIYMALLKEGHEKMQNIKNIVENCEKGKTLHAVKLAGEVGLSKYVIRAIFQIYKEKGYGYCSGGIRGFRYTSNVA